MAFHVYILRCADGSYYVGHTENLEQRLAAHQAGAITGYTKNRRPVELVWSDTFESRDDAFARERQLKGWSRRKKEAVIRGDWASLPAFSRSYTAVVAAQAGPAHPGSYTAVVAAQAGPAHPEPVEG